MANSIIKKLALLGTGGIILFSTLSFKSDFFEIAKQLEIFTTLFKELNMNYVDETNPAALMDTAIKAMLKDLDPYTVYWNEQDVEAARINSAGEYSGIGAAIDIRNNKITIVEPFKDYPADKAGLKAGDVITKIGEVQVSEFPETAGELLKGAPNSEIKISFLRQGELKNTVLTRGAVDIKAVPYYSMLEGKTGYVVLSQFSKTASSETKNALKKLKDEGATKIILDLRGNPGGLLSEAINVANLFLPEHELIVSTKSNIEKYNKEFYTQKKAFDPEIPLVVLINGRSASASEIVAGALQDLDRAVIVGSRSFGKGLVQRRMDLTYGTKLKLTISRYYTPSGRCIQALDYRKRDEAGNAIRVKKEDYNKFSTRNGRSVYDGGGILPDVSMTDSEYTGIVKTLLEENAVFDYATQYFYSHELKDPSQFEFTDEDYLNFLQFVQKREFGSKSPIGKELSDVVEIASEEGMNDDISQEIAALQKSISAARNQQILDKKEEITNLLSDEILKRYFYKEGLYDFHVKHNPEILKAVEILSNPSGYGKILSN